MTTTTHQDATDREDRVHAMRAALVVTALVGGLLGGTVLVISQVVGLLAWAFASH